MSLIELEEHQIRSCADNEKDFLCFIDIKVTIRSCLKSGWEVLLGCDCSLEDAVKYFGIVGVAIYYEDLSSEHSSYGEELAGVTYDDGRVECKFQ